MFQEDYSGSNVEVILRLIKEVFSKLLAQPATEVLLSPTLNIDQQWTSVWPLINDSELPDEGDLKVGLEASKQSLIWALGWLC